MPMPDGGYVMNEGTAPCGAEIYDPKVLVFRQKMRTHIKDCGKSKCRKFRESGQVEKLWEGR